MGRALIVIVTRAFCPIIEEKALMILTAVIGTYDIDCCYDITRACCLLFVTRTYDIDGFYRSYHMWGRASIRFIHLGFLIGSSCVFCNYGEPDVPRHVARLNYHVLRIVAAECRD